MKQTGIIMSGNHPKLILDNRKSMTRRTWGLGEVNKNPDNWEYLGAPYGIWRFGNKITEEYITIKCPYGQVGDRLWVRETYYIADHLYNPTKVHYRASEPYFAGYESVKWKPSIFMPRWASRITLEITEVRAERLRKATLVDAIAEGFSTIAELIKAVLHLNHLPEDADPWVGVISFRLWLIHY